MAKYVNVDKLKQELYYSDDAVNMDGEYKGLWVRWKAIEDLLNGAQALPPVTPTQRWIPVSERLPEEGKEVLAYYEYFRYGDYNCMWPTYGVGYQYDGLWCGDVRGHKLNVIAWHPLPQPYEEEQDGI